MCEVMNQTETKSALSENFSEELSENLSEELCSSQSYIQLLFIFTIMTETSKRKINNIYKLYTLEKLNSLRREWS